MSHKVQVLIYTSYLHIIGGIETFTINFLDLLGDEYDVGVLCPRLPDEIANKINPKAKLFTKQEPIECDTLIMVRMMDAKPSYVKAKKSIRMCHACKSNPSWYIRQDCDRIVHVSEASKMSFNSDGDVIYNPLFKTQKDSLLLVSATRIPALDKGKNAERMISLAKMLNKAEIPFVWMNFSDAPLQNAPKGFVNVGTFQDLQPFIARADYLVQLSDQEGFGYSVVEALINKTAVICTPFETTKELGVIDGENGYVIPFDLDFDVKKLLTVPQFGYSWDNKKIKAKWKKLLNARPPKKRAPEMVFVQTTLRYFDVELNRYLAKGDRLYMPRERAELLATKYKYVRIIKEET